MEKNLAVLSYKETIEQKLIVGLDGKINTIIAIAFDEGHQFRGMCDTIHKQLVSTVSSQEKIKKFIFIGNYTKKYLIERNDKKVYLEPTDNTPFAMYSPGRQLSFLDITEPVNDKETKISFIYYNHNIQRDIIFCELYKRNLLENVIYHSDRKNSHEINTVYSKENDFISNGYDGFQTYEEIKTLIPKKIDNHDAYFVNYYPNTINIASKSLFYIVVESNLGCEPEFNVNILTEKSVTPFFSKSIPIFITQDTLSTIEWFENLGFDCFTDVISVDIHKLNFVERVKTLLNIVENTDITFFQKNIDRFNKNYNLAKYLTYKGNSIYKTIDNIAKEHNLQIIDAAMHLNYTTQI